MHLQLDPPFMPIHTALLAMGAASVVLALYLRREWGARTPRRLALAGLRTVFVVSLAIILLNPVVTAARDAARGKPTFLLLLDTSRSMCTPDAGGASRWQAARTATIENRALLDDLAARYNVRVFAFADRPEAANPDGLAKLRLPNGDRTNLGTAIAGALNAAGGGKGGGQVLLVSDGRDTSDSFPLDAARAAKAQGYEVSTLCLGKQTDQRDLQVVARKPQMFAAPRQTVQLAAEIRDVGIPRATVRAELLRDGRPAASQDVVVEPGRRDVTFPVTQPKQGLYRYAIRVTGAPEERDEANNRASVFLNVTNTRARVLFLEGRPSWDSKFLAQALRADPTVTVDVIYKLTDQRFFAVVGGEQKEQGIVLPRTLEQMSRYDVILFGKGFEEFYDGAGAATLKQWVSERGGNVVFLRGRPDERTAALREMEPVTWSDRELNELRVRLTEEGKSHPGFAFSVSDDAQTVVQKLPPLISATQVQGEKALAVVLARAENAEDNQSAREMATVAYQRYGQGKVMAIVGQGMWRWAFLPPDLERYGRAYNEFWSQTIRWLVSESDFLPGQSMSVRADRTRYAPGDTVSFYGYLRGHGAGAPPALTLMLPNGRTARVATARSDGRHADFMATYRPMTPGEYVVSTPAPPGKAAPMACVFTVAPGQEEDLNRSADPDLMRQLASVGGGVSVAPGEVLQLPDRLRAEELARQKRVEPHSAWDRPWVLGALFALLGSEWLLRRRSGMA